MLVTLIFFVPLQNVVVGMIFTQGSIVGGKSLPTPPASRRIFAPCLLVKPQPARRCAPNRIRSLLKCGSSGLPSSRPHSPPSRPSLPPKRR